MLGSVRPPALANADRAAKAIKRASASGISAPVPARLTAHGANLQSGVANLATRVSFTEATSQATGASERAVRRDGSLRGSVVWNAETVFSTFENLTGFPDASPFDEVAENCADVG
jgi:hypothetical protein